MALYQAIQKLLLIGVRLPAAPNFTVGPAPTRLHPLISAIQPEHHRFDQRALHYGKRYRSGFWAIYLLSALAVLCAVLPLALGWDSSNHALHPYAGMWAVGEVFLIATVSAIYWAGHRRDWQGQWLRARTTAELAWYLPMLAPLLDLGSPDPEPNWYVRAFDPDQHLRTADDVALLCRRIEPQARELLADAWVDPDFITEYARWTIGILEQQRNYHHGTAFKQHALLHRVHRINTGLFGLTALAASLHLLIHTLWLSLITTFFPALGASLHGALAQSESYRLATTSERLSAELHTAAIRIAKAAEEQPCGAGTSPLRQAVEAAIELILEEHQDWNLLVRPHRLPLA